LLVREPAAKPTTKGQYGTKKMDAEGGGRMARRDEGEKRNRESVLLPHTCALMIKRPYVHRGLVSLCSGPLIKVAIGFFSPIIYSALV
jgi:hypothetical protein